MCGICGIYHPRGGSSSWHTAVRSLNDAIIHRGPDEEGYFDHEDVTLGMRRLKVIDLTKGAQPISSEKNDVHIVFNGEIYDFEAIRKQLEQSGHRFKTDTDTEALIHLYEEHGLSFLDHCDGMFAFALWDENRKRLVIARDRFGIKPLFYTHAPGGGVCAFASEIQPLLRLPFLSKEIDPVALDHYFTNSYIPHPRSIYKSIKKLRPGHFLVFENGSVKEMRYWDLPERTETLPSSEALRALDAAISCSVKKMLRSDVPLGAFLSGGLDSGSVVHYIRQHTGNEFHTFSVRFKNRSFDEGMYARQVAERYRTTHHEIWGMPDDVKLLPLMNAHFGEPFADASQIPTYLVSRLARRHVVVAMSGDGGDEILGGYETYCASMFLSYGRAIPETVRKALQWLAFQMPPSLRHAGLDYKIQKFLTGCRLPPLQAHSLWRTIFSLPLRQELYSDYFRGILGEEIAVPPFKQWNAFFDNGGIDPLTQFQYLDAKTYLTDNNLVKVDRMSMAHSLEVRIPLLDLGVVAASLKLPPSLRIRGLRTKIGLRTLMNGKLPEQVTGMRKRGFAVPLASWFRHELGDYVRDTLHTERIRKLRVLNPSAVEELVEAHMSGRRNNVRQIWNLICFVHWYESKEAHV